GRRRHFPGGRHGEHCPWPDTDPGPAARTAARPELGPHQGEKMSDTAFSVRELYVSYGNIEAVRGISFDIPRGASLALVGHNGAGTTSTLLALSGGLQKRAYRGGMASGNGAGDPQQAGTTLVPEREKVFSLLTVQENLLAV